MESVAVRKKVEDDENRANRLAYDENAKGMSSIARENSQFVKEQKLIAKDQIKQQDENLTKLDQSLTRLQVQATDIKSELGEQNQLLNKLGNEIDDAQDRMNVVQAALSKLLKTKDGCMIWTIVSLALILIILVALIIWT